MPNVATSHEFVTGIATSSEQNSYVRDPITHSQNPPIARLRQTTLLNVPNNAFTAVTFQAEDVDKDPTGAAAGGHSTAVNISRFTAVYPGYYEFGGGVAFAADATNQRGSRWAVNGAAVLASAVLLQAVAGGNFSVVPARLLQVFLQIGDYCELQAYQNRGSALDTVVSGEYSCSMEVRWVSL